MKKIFRGICLLLLTTSITSCVTSPKNTITQNYGDSLEEVNEGKGIHVINENKDFYIKEIGRIQNDKYYSGMFLVKTVDNECFIISPQSIVIFENYKCPFNHK